jgi:hypothetical protein
MQFWTKCSIDLGLQPKYSPIKVWNFVWSSNNCVKKIKLMIALFHKTILRHMGWLNGGADGEVGFAKIWTSKRPYLRLESTIPWFTMGYRFNQQASLASLSPYFLFVHT